MDGFKEVNFYEKAHNMGLIPNSSHVWELQNDVGAYHDLHKQFPVIGSPVNNGNVVSCVVINKKDRKYEYSDSHVDKVQRLCRGLILKNNLSNL